LKGLSKLISLLRSTMQNENRRASESIFFEMNSTLLQVWTTDLHGQHVREITYHLTKTLMDLYHGGVRHLKWTIITGKGIHSGPEGPKLPAALAEWLGEKDLTANTVEQQDGQVQVVLSAETFARLDVANWYLPE
ncbi:hypothetical protein VaNZ11_009894, partial [Volvox africanus]